MESDSINPIFSGPEFQFLQKLEDFTNKGAKIHFIGTFQISSSSQKKSEDNTSTINLINSIEKVNQYLEHNKQNEKFADTIPLPLLKNLEQVAFQKLKRKIQSKSPSSELELATAKLSSTILELEKAHSGTPSSSKISNLPYQSNVLNLNVQPDINPLHQLDFLLIELHNAITDKFLDSEFDTEEDKIKKEVKTPNGIAILSRENLEEVQKLVDDIKQLRLSYDDLIQSNEGKRIFINQVNSTIKNLAIAYSSYHSENKFSKLDILASMIESLQNLASSAASFESTHPLYDLEKSILGEIAKQPVPYCGAYFTGFGGEHVKGGHLHGDLRLVDGKEIILLEFKINYFTRLDLDIILKYIITNSSYKEKKEDSNLITDQLNIKLISNQDREFRYFYLRDDQGHYSSTDGYTPRDKRRNDKDLRFVIIEFEKLGKMTLCVDMDTGTLYDRIKLELTRDQLKGKNSLNEISKLLGILGLGTALIPQSTDDEMRIKIFTLLEFFHPIKAIDYYTNVSNYQISIEALKATVIANFPDMQEQFDVYLKENGMKKIELFSGKTTWAISNMVPLLQQKGVWGLTCGLTGKGKNDIRLAGKTIAHIIKSQLGMLSSENRFGFGIYLKGASANADFGSRGAPFTFWRLVSKIPSTHQPDNYPWKDYLSLVYFIVTLDPLQNGQACFHDDCFGRTNLYNPGSYVNPNIRGGLIEDCEKIDEDWEVILKDRVQPQYIAGLLVGTQEDKDVLVEILTELEVIKNGKVQLTPDVEIAVDHFIYVGENLTKEMFKL